MCLLNTGNLEILQDHLREGLFFLVVSAGLRDVFGIAVDQLIVLVHPKHPVRREALNRERPGHANYLLVVVGLVVEFLRLGLGCDGGVDLLLPRNAGLPPVCVQLLRRVGPLSVSLAWNLPLLPGLLERGVQRLAQRLQLPLPFVPDHVDLCVVGDGFKRDVRHSLIDEAMADIPVHRLRTRRGASDFGFLELAFTGIGQQVKRITRAHDAGTGQRQSHARGVNRDPAAAPLLGHIGCRTRAAGWVEDEIARVSAR